MDTARETDHMIADAHAHIFPDKIAGKASGAIGEFYEIQMSHVGKIDELLDSGGAIGVSKYLVCSTATRPDQATAINNFIAASCAARPGLFYGFGTLHPEQEGRERELLRIRSLGLRGIKFHPDFQQFDIDDPDMLPCYRLAAELGLPILFHTGDDRYDHSAPSRLANVLERVPGLTAIAAHLGGYKRWDEALSALAPGSVWTDTSSSMSMMPRERALELIEHFGTDRVLFGADFPMWDHTNELQVFLSLGFDRGTNQRILHDNFCTLMGIEK